MGVARFEIVGVETSFCVEINDVDATGNEGFIVKKKFECLLIDDVLLLLEILPFSALDHVYIYIKNASGLC